MNTLTIPVRLTNSELQTLRRLLSAEIEEAKSHPLTPVQETQQKHKCRLMRKITSALEDLTDATF